MIYHGFVVAGLLALAATSPISEIDKECQCPEKMCILELTKGCECQLANYNECVTNNVLSGNVCSMGEFSKACIEVLQPGKENDSCNAFTIPLQPLCGPGLVCVLGNSLATDQGGKCKPITKENIPNGEGKPCQIGGGIGDTCAGDLVCTLSYGQSPCASSQSACPGICQKA